jgi:hypothetical protein
MMWTFKAAGGGVQGLFLSIRELPAALCLPCDGEGIRCPPMHGFQLCGHVACTGGSGFSSDRGGVCLSGLCVLGVKRG